MILSHAEQVYDLIHIIKELVTVCPLGLANKDLIILKNSIFKHFSFSRENLNLYEFTYNLLFPYWPSYLMFSTSLIIMLFHFILNFILLYLDPNH